MDLKVFKKHVEDRLFALSGDSNFKVLLSKNFGPKNEDQKDLPNNYRDEIRQTLESLKWPHPESGRVSMTHTLGLGGLVYHPQKMVGIDLEITSRVREKVAARVCTTDELKMGMSPAQLWVAKESAFKTGRVYPRPEVISMVQITGFEPQGYSFSFSLENKMAGVDGQGLLFEYSLYTLAIAYLL